MKTYLVGGAVRDKLLNYPIIDRDWVVVGADVEQMLALNYTPVGADFPVFLHPATKEEYALARTERKSGKGYKGFSFYAAKDVTLEQDLSRRDLTINAMAEDEGVIFDPFSGLSDLKNKVLRHVSSAFSEDPLRVLRTARFAARYAHLGFTIADETLNLMRHLSMSGELSHLTKERVWQELERALSEKTPLVFFIYLEQTNALSLLFPTLRALIQNIQLLIGSELDNSSTICSSTTCSPALQLALSSLQSSEQRLTWIYFVSQLHLSDQEIQSNTPVFTKDLRCPNHTKLTIELSIELFLLLKQWSISSAKQRLAFIRKAALLRPDSQLKNYTTTVKALNKIAGFLPNKISSNHTNAYFDEDNISKFTLLVNNLKLIDHKSLIRKGFKGPELGAEIHRIKLQLCS